MKRKEIKKLKRKDREIIFRAWHKKMKAMLYPPNSIDSMFACRDSKGQHRYVKVKDMFTKKTEKYALQAFMMWDGRWYVAGKYQDVVWMQYTGLKDIKDKKIFEGDIIYVEHGSEKRQAWYVVKWDDNKMCFFLELKLGTCGCQFERRFMGDYDVVGNIFEHPNILKGKLK